MENNYSFRFKLIETIPYVKKDGNKGVRIVAYCSFGFIVNLFTTEENSKIIIEKAKIKNNDISQFVSVFYDHTSDNFSYFLTLK